MSITKRDVQSAYQEFLKRDPWPAEVEAWIARVETIRQLKAGVAGSPERAAMLQARAARRKAAMPFVIATTLLAASLMIGVWLVQRPDVETVYRQAVIVILYPLPIIACFGLLIVGCLWVARQATRLIMR